VVTREIMLERWRDPLIKNKYLSHLSNLNRAKRESPKGYNSLLSKNSEELSYVFGAFVGDGYLYSNGRDYRLDFYVKDKDFLDSINKSVRNILKRKREYPLFTSGKYHILRIYSKEIFLLFKENKESYELAYSHPSSFLRGLYDAEGSVSELMRGKVPRVCLYNRNRRLMEISYNLLKSLGINSKLNAYINKGKMMYRISIHRKKDIVTFSKSIGFTIRRKQQKIDKWIREEK